MSRIAVKNKIIARRTTPVALPYGLVERFYDIMNSDPKTTGIRAMPHIGIAEQAMLKLEEALGDLADFMRNRPAA